jgi:glycosyltransferase 2 family protein
MGRRLRSPRTVVSFGIGAAIVAFLVTRLDIEPREVWANLRRADPLRVALAVGVYYSTFMLRSVRWKFMLERAGAARGRTGTLPGYPRFVEIFLLAWFVNCVVPAKLGDAYRAYLVRQDAGVPIGTALGTILAERLIDLCVLFLAMSTAGLLAFRGDLPSQVLQTMLFGVGLIVLAIGIVVVVLVWRPDRLERLLPSRLRGHLEPFRAASLASLASPWRSVGISGLIWLFDGVRLYLVATALGAGVTAPLSLFVSLMAALATTLPVTPAGLGVVEAAMVVVLKLVDVPSSVAGSVALVDRLITFWSLVLVGIVLYVRRVRREMAGRTGQAG